MKEEFLEIRDLKIEEMNEKQLTMYRRKHLGYKRRVNRCIPWKR